ncbi:hypothetical protein ACH5RR_000935 [Cinchona calisaya]|uniref:Transposase n=1 Tax=Cinchona calisaya TaxID=153742 RepID=A0ABD3B244_9GENT
MTKTDVNGETNGGDVNGGTTEGSEVLEGGINSGAPVRLICMGANEADVDGNSFMSDFEGHYTSEDGGSCDEKEFEGYSNFCRDDYMDYGKPPLESQVLDEEQGEAQEVASNQGAAQEAASNQDAAQEATSNQGTGAEFECAGAGIVGSSGDEFERSYAAGSTGAKQKRAHTEDKHVEPDSVDHLLSDPQRWELNSNPGSSDDEEQSTYTNFRGDRDMTNSTFRLGIKFVNKQEFKESLKGLTDTTVEVMYTLFREPGCNPRFMRFYCALGPLKKGFKTGCRPILSLDGCHTKGPYPSQRLTAIGVDPNNGW